MAWKDGNTYLKAGKSWKSSGGVTHPSNWMIWSDTHKTDVVGLTWEDDVVLGVFDDFYYYGWNSDGDALLPKPLAGLKVSKVNIAKQTTANYLSETDWYVVRKTEKNTAIPSEITAFRDAVRANYTVLKTAINNASDIAGLQSCYTYTATSADPATIQIDATSSSVVSTSDNTITSNGHGFVNDEQLSYRADFNSDGETAAVIAGLVNGATYFVIATATNTFKLSESHSNCGDEAVVSLTGLSSDGDAQTFTSQGKPSVGQTWPNSDMLKYDGA